MVRTREYIIYMAPMSVSYTFRDFECAMKHGWKMADYVPVWRGTISSETVNDALERLFVIFNTDERPPRYRGRSLSMSDVVVLDGIPYYCDNIGWSECPIDC